ncbi:MAG: hypothetical protein AABW93_03155 [Nanoarchaeota archaeon]
MPDIFGKPTNPTNRPAGYSPDKYEAEALEMIRYEKAQWDDAAVFITEKKQYLMRNVIDKARRYYHGIFDSAKDEVTGENKTWVPLTEWSVESVVKSVDLDTKDILIQPGTPSAVNITPIIRAIILNTLKKVGFGKLLNETIRVLSRDGTAVVKTYDVIDPKTKRKTIKSKLVDVLNIWIDPSSDSMQESTVIERSFLSEADIADYKDVWNNTEYISFSLNVPRLEGLWSFGSGKMPQTETYERWGKIKKSWITKKDSDSDIWVEGHIISSGLGTPQVAHLIRENPRDDKLKPYEEVWYRKVDGRWYGRGIPEMLFGLQEYTNIVVNTRKNNNMVLQNGIFLIRKGSGITPDMVSSLSAGGGIPVTDIDRDIKQLTTQDYRASSYSDEGAIYNMADRVTSSFDINRGEAGRSSASATATLTQDRNIRDTFVLVQEGIGFFVENLIVRQYIPLLKQIMKNEDIVRVTGDADMLAYIDEAIVNGRLNDFKQKAYENTGFYPEPEDIQSFMDQQVSFLKSMGKSRFIKYFKGLFDEEIDVDVTVTDERFNRIVAVQHLKDSLIAYGRLPVASKLNIDAVFREIFNLMGIRGEFFLEKPLLPVYGTAAAGQAGRLMKEFPEGAPSEVTAMENASGLPQVGGAIPGVEALSPRLNINTAL